jgi:N-acyl-D-aspartate/D-glutamate deacylase
VTRARHRAARSVFGFKALTIKLETAGGFGLNVACLSDHNSVRASVMGVENRARIVVTVVELVIQSELRGGSACIYHVLAEEDVQRTMRRPQAMIASDGHLSQPGKDHPHPRAYATFPRVLGECVRAHKTIVLNQALFKIIGQPAKRLGLTDRGRIAIDYYGDLALIDLATVAAMSNFEDPHRYPPESRLHARPAENRISFPIAERGPLTASTAENRHFPRCLLK